MHFTKNLHKLIVLRLSSISFLIHCYDRCSISCMWWPLFSTLNKWTLCHLHCIIFRRLIKFICVWVWEWLLLEHITRKIFWYRNNFMSSTHLLEQTASHQEFRHKINKYATNTLRTMRKFQVNILLKLLFQTRNPRCHKWTHKHRHNYWNIMHIQLSLNEKIL